MLEQADVVMHDSLAHPDLLEFCRGALIEDVGERAGSSGTEQQDITRRMVEHARAGRRVVRLKAGDPFVFAHGAEEATALVDAGIPFEIVPGVSSPVGTSAFAGFPLTHRGLSSSVAFVTDSDSAGEPWSSEEWLRVANATDTLCILMGSRRLDELIPNLIEAGRSARTPAALIQWGARPEQRVVEVALEELPVAARAGGLEGPALLVIGDVVTLRDKLRWFDNRPLFGKRLLIPRPLEQGQETAKAVRNRGAAPLVMPAIELMPPPEPARLREAVQRLESYDWVVFTSANGVDATLRALDEAGRDVRAFGHAKLAAIGPKTAQALRCASLKADLVAERFVAEVLAAELLATSPTPQRVLLLRALVAREVLPERLRAEGVQVDVVPAYQTRPVSGAAQRALRELIEKRHVDAVLLTSSSMVDSLCAALGEEAPRLLERVAIATIGPVTSETARAKGLRLDVEAAHYTVDGLLDALEDFYTEAGAPSAG